eukprot:scaffold130102_cov13-Tisochrysis_lutea.AAC.1
MQAARSTSYSHKEKRETMACPGTEGAGNQKNCGNLEAANSTRTLAKPNLTRLFEVTVQDKHKMPQRPRALNI